MTIDYGRDLFCAEDLHPEMPDDTGPGRVARALLRRYMTPRGTMADDSNYGLDLRDEVNDSTDARSIAMLRGQIIAEAMKEEAVLSADATVTYADESLSVSIFGQSADGPFSLTLGVDALTVELLTYT